MLEVYTYVNSNTVIPTALEIIEKGWIPLLKAGVVAIATTGQLVWVTDSVGRKSVAEANSSTIQLYLNAIGRYTGSPTFAAAGAKIDSTAAHSLYAKKYNIVTCQSNVGGTLDADVDFVSATASYTAHMMILNCWSDGAETPTWEWEDDDGALLSTTTPAHTAGRVEEFLKGTILIATADNKKIYLDTTSANLGNAVSYRWLIVYWYET